MSTDDKWPKRKKRVCIRKVRNVPIEDILRMKPLPVGTSTLTPDQSDRLRKVWQEIQRFPGLHPSPSFEGFELEFSRDIHPDREIQLYENLAARLRKVKTMKRAKEVVKRWLKDCPPILIVKGPKPPPRDTTESEYDEGR
jgi:hypothetical protein